MNDRALLRPIAALSLLALAVATLPVPADSHAVLVRSTPAARAVLSHPLDRVRLWFNERLEPAFSSVTVWSGSGARMDRQDVRVGPDDPNQLSVTLPALDPGTYTVRFRVLSVDGHIVEGNFSFMIKTKP